jgi:hypothetical protein
MLTKNEAVQFEELHTLMKTEEDLLKSAVDNSKEIAHMAMVANKNSQPSFNTPSMLNSMETMEVEAEIRISTIVEEVMGGSRGITIPVVVLSGEFQCWEFFPQFQSEFTKFPILEYKP